MFINQNCTIAIIDSGIGGISVLNQLISRYKTGNYIYFADNLYMPYGNKSKHWLTKRIESIINSLQNKYKVDYIIIACNTASANVDPLKFKNLFVMKFDDKNKYLATKLTKESLPNLDVIIDTTLAKQIEKNIFNNENIFKTIKNHVKKYKLDELSSLVLGCTHYELVEKEFKKQCPNTYIQLNSSFILDNLNFDNMANELNVVTITSKNSEDYKNKINNLIRRL